MKKAFLIIIMLWLGCSLYPASAQENYQQTTGSGIDPQDSLRFNELMRLYGEHYKSDPDASQPYADELPQVARRMGDWPHLKLAYRVLAQLARKRGRLQLLPDYYLQLLHTAKQLHDPRETFEACDGLVSAYLDGGTWPMAKRYIDSCMMLARQNNNDTQKAIATRSLAHYYMNSNATRQAINTFRQSLVFTEKTGSSEDIANNRYFLAQLLLQSGVTTQQVITLLTAALETYKADDNTFRQAQCRELFSLYYYQKGNLDYAIDNLEIARSLYKAEHNMLSYAASGMQAASFTLNRQKTKNVAHYLEESERIFAEIGYEAGLLQTEITWGNYYAQCKQFRKANAYFSRAWPKVQGEDRIIEKLVLEQSMADALAQQGRLRESDSMFFSYFRDVFNTKEAPVILNDYRTAIVAGEIFTKGDSVLFSLLQQPEGPQLLKANFNKAFRGKLFDTALIAMAAKSPFYAHTAKDSLASFDEHFANLEARENRDIFRNEALKMEAQADASGRIQQRTMFVAIGLALGLLLLVLVLRWLFKRWKRSERDKALARQESEMIKAFQHQNNHLLQNNFRFFHLFLEHAKKAPRPDDTMAVLQNRLVAIAKLLQLLQDKTDSNDAIDLGLFIREVWLTLSHSLGIYEDVEADIDADVMLKGEQVILLGYILTELITNSSKHAFKDQEEKRITILAVRQDGLVRFSYRDNGPGMPPEYRQGQGIGLIEMFSLDLSGTYNWHDDEGLRFDLVFKRQDTEDTRYVSHVQYADL